MPIAIKTDKPKTQHYELPTSFFKLVLGKNFKYRCFVSFYVLQVGRVRYLCFIVIGLHGCHVWNDAVVVTSLMGRELWRMLRKQC